MKKNILITGVAGFIGFHLAKYLIKKKFNVYGLDNYSRSYELKIKKLRIQILKKNTNFLFVNKDIKKIESCFKNKKFDAIFHLAAEAGVRRSLKKPLEYIEENISNTVRVFEYAKKNKIKKIYYASSSSIYGDKGIYPTDETVTTDQPISIYGITKISTENIAYYYFKIFNINSVGFRFFTVFGPYGRPDMSIFIFIKSILKNKIIYLNNYGKNFRDFTYVDNIISYMLATFNKTNNQKKFFHIFNIGGEKTISINSLVKKIENYLGLKAKTKNMPKINLDPVYSLATTKKIKKFLKKKFTHNFDEGLKETIRWMKTYI
jgi:UDP-glucuronate 4-epimerase